MGKKKKTNQIKVGICTLYYANRNYGGVLQAYALCKAIERFGYSPEMISYVDCALLHSSLSRIKQCLLGTFVKKEGTLASIETRNDAIDNFRNSIPHSKLYFSNTIKKANDCYDIFIAGSDQVWNPYWINRFMSLSFVKEKHTVAYAASVGKTNLDLEQQDKLRIALKHTDVISIREKDSIPALKKLTNKSIEYVLDPTLLLTGSEWDEISTKRLIDENYMFCYFLRDDENLRNAANQYAKKNGLKIATIPYMNGKYRKEDDGFGDYALFDVSPKEFISLIKYASFVLTDSFHGTVFSHLYEKKFVVTNGRNNNEMGCRMQSLTEMFGTEDRYIKDSEKVTVELLTELFNIPLVIDWNKFEVMKQHSIDFLEKALKQ